MRTDQLLQRTSAATNTRPPQPGTIRRWLWLTLIGAPLIGWGLPRLANWPALPTPIWTMLDRLAASPLTSMAQRVTWGLLALLALDVAGGLLVRVLQRRTAVQRTTLHRRMRVPRPVAQPGVRPRLVPDTDLWQALLPALAPTTDLLGRRPQATFTIAGTPNSAATLGYVISGGSDAERQQTVRALDGALHGAAPDAVIDAVPDALHAGRAPGRVLAWREYALMLPAEYPLRRADDVDVAPLLGPVLQALQPVHGCVATELQTGVRPLLSMWASFADRGWRARARSLLWDLKHARSAAQRDDVQTIEAKLNDAACSVTLRAVVVATSEQAAQHALDRIDGALAGYREGTGHYAQQWRIWRSGFHPWGEAEQNDRSYASILARAHRPAAPPSLFLPPAIWRTAPVLSAGEVGALWHLPTAKLSSMVAGLPNRILRAPAVTFIPPGATDRIRVGYARQGDGTLAPVGPSLRDLATGFVATAGMGAYKTCLALNLCIQFLRMERGLIVGDGKGDSVGGSLVTKTREQLTLGDEARLVLIDPLDVDWPVGFNLLHGVALDTPGAVSRLQGQLAALMERIDPEGWQGAHGMKDLLDMATILVCEGFRAEDRTPILQDIMQALQDAAFRERLLPHCSNLLVRDFWTRRPGDLPQLEAQSRDALLRRFKTLLASDLLRGIVSQPLPHFTWEQALRDKLIVLFPLPHNALGGLAGALASLVVQLLVRATLARPGNALSRPVVPAVFDEVQVWTEHGDGKDIETMLTQFREYAVPPLFFHQTLDQWKHLLSLVRSNVGCRMLLRCDDPDATTLAREYAAWSITDADLKAQHPAEHQYAVLRINNNKVGPLSIVPDGWPEPLPIQFGMAGAWQGPGDQQRDTWQHEIPADSTDPQFDREVCQLVYYPPDRVALDAFARKQSDVQWQRYLDRWAVISDHQRRYLLAHPWLRPHGAPALVVALAGRDAPCAARCGRRPTLASHGAGAGPATN